jgi:hypothetical protein
MRKIAFLICIFLLQGQVAFAKDLRGFLKNCAWGTLGGAAAGVVSLAFIDKPSESWGNVARGASLGLYAGIAYGLVQLNQESKVEGQADFAVFPAINQGQISGVQMTATLVRF